MSLQKKSSQEHRCVGRSLDRPPIGERLAGERNLLEHVDPGQNLAYIVIGLVPRLLEVGESCRPGSTPAATSLARSFTKAPTSKPPAGSAGSSRRCAVDSAVMRSAMPKRL